jgi:hypothetical protein
VLGREYSDRGIAGGVVSGNFSWAIFIPFEVFERDFDRVNKLVDLRYLCNILALTWQNCAFLLVSAGCACSVLLQKF